MIDHEQYKAMLAARALGGLIPEEKRSLARHLDACAECRAEVQGWQETASMLAYSVEPSSPRSDVRSSLLSTIHLISRDDNQKTELRGGPADASEPLAKVIPFTKPERRTLSWSGKFGAIAASLVIAALLIPLLIVWRQNTRLRTELAQSENQRSETQAELARGAETVNQVQGELEERSRRDSELQAEMDRLKSRDGELQRQIAGQRGRNSNSEYEQPGNREAEGLFTAPGSRVVTLAGTSAAPRAHARMAFDRTTGRAMMFAYGLPQAPPGKAYQLWFIAGGKALPGTVFKANASGSAVMHTQVPSAGLNASVFAVTLEPKDGVSAPTGEKYLVGSGI